MNLTLKILSKPKKLNKMKTTAPGKDGVKYSQLKRADPGCLVLQTIYNSCFKEEKTPKAWDSSRTVLIHKKGNHRDLNNWRPLTLGNTIAKLYARITSSRVCMWTAKNNIISPKQKGFVDTEGCYGNNFIVQSIIDDSRRNGKEAVLAWLDLSNAFCSIPHKHINNVLQNIRFPEKLRNIIHNIYRNTTTTITTPEGDTEDINIKSGVKQRCPLSPIIFNIAIEPLLRTVQSVQHDCGYIGILQDNNSEDNVLRASRITMKLLHKADKKIKDYVKKWLHLPQRASPEIFQHIKGEPFLFHWQMLARFQRQSTLSSYLYLQMQPSKTQPGSA